VTAVKTAMHACLLADIPVLLWGDPGTAKSAVVEQIAAEVKGTMRILIGASMEPTDVVGLPYIDPDARVTRYAMPDWAYELNAAAEAHPDTIHFLFADEFNLAAPAVQSAMLTLIRERRTASFSLAPNIRIVAAGNPSNSAGYDWAMSMAAANRWCHLDWVAPYADWKRGMIDGFDSISHTNTNLIEPTASRRMALNTLITQFTDRVPQHRHALPDNPDELRWPSIRTWQYLATALAYVRPEDLSTIRLLANGIVGEAAGHAFFEYFNNLDLPDPADVAADPSIVDWSDRPDRLRTIALSVASYMGDSSHSADETKRLWDVNVDILGRLADAGKKEVGIDVFKVMKRYGPPGADIGPEISKKYRAALAKSIDGVSA
jgi:hypothetical protein